jgi:mono/diheme cytochrome c family protein
MSPHVRRTLLLALVLALLAAGCGGSGEADPLADGSRVYGRMCAACHGSQGQGGIGPALDSVVDTFPSCADHMAWVRLGSDRWQEAHGPTYGAPERPVTGGMPGFEARLSAEEIAAVAAFQRVRHGGAPPEASLAECGVPAVGG